MALQIVKTCRQHKSLILYCLQISNKRKETDPSKYLVLHCVVLGTRCFVHLTVDIIPANFNYLCIPTLTFTQVTMGLVRLSLILLGLVDTLSSLYCSPLVPTTVSAIGNTTQLSVSVIDRSTLCLMTRFGRIKYVIRKDVTIG